MWLQNQSERRTNQRYGSICPVDLLMPDGKQIRGYSSQIARDSLTIHTERSIPEQTELNAVLHMLHPCSNQRVPVYVRISVISCTHDSISLDFRAGTIILVFHGDTESLYKLALGAWEQSASKSALLGTASGGVESRLYPLQRRVLLALPDIDPVVAWTASISTQAVSVALTIPTRKMTTCAICLPIMPPDDKKRYLIEVETEVTSVVLRSSGDYLTTMRFLDMERTDSSLLRSELRQRFGTECCAA